VLTCNAQGQYDAPVACTGGTPFCAGGVCQAAVCGNGTPEGNEQCDDGNTTKCDGCEGCERRRWLNVPAKAYATVPGLAAKLPAGNACYEVWAKHLATADAIYLSSTSDSTHSNIMLRCLSGKTLQFGSENGLGTALVTEPSAPCGNNAWHHVAGCRTINGSQVTYTVYFDGQPAGSVTGSTSAIAAASLPYIGGVAYVQDGLSGSIDELRISNTLRYVGAFTPERRFSADASTIALFHFDEGSGTTATDSSANALTATLVGTSWSQDTGYLPSMCQ
jgi:cysteine-rich repeat protein